MESLNFESSSGSNFYDVLPAMVGVVSSGNLEVLIEKSDENICKCQIVTSEIGYMHIWKVVINDFFSKYQLTRTNVFINDSGASPSVVSLRLDQAVEKFKGANHD
jgi:malonate decarboxylase delta subunit